METNCASFLELSRTDRIDRSEQSRQSIAQGNMRSAECSLEPIDMPLHYRSCDSRLADENPCRSDYSSHECLSSLYTDHHKHVLHVCRRFFRRPEDAEDAAAEVFLKLYRVLHTKRQDRPFRPWLCQVAGRHCIDKLRKRKSEASSLSNDVDVHAIEDTSAPSALSQILREEAVREVREELNRLPHYYRIPLILRYYKRMSYFDIARTLGRGLPAVKMVILRAKRRLRRNLRGGDVAVRRLEPTATQRAS